MITKISNIKKIVTWDDIENKLSFLESKSIYLKDNKIYKISEEEIAFDNEIDAENSILTPGFIDCHTHPIFVEHRANEYYLRSIGKKYEEISLSGGGINRSVEQVRKISEEDLYDISIQRMDDFLFNGTTTIEAKSGYGLNLDDEIKLLNVIKRIHNAHPLDLIPTFLGAHSIPQEFKNNPSSYVDLICNKIIPKVSELKLAKFCDVFCEEGYFNYEDSKKILEIGKKFGLLPRLHADEFNDSRGLELAIEVGALSVDHLMETNQNFFKTLGQSDTIATLLPGTTFFLGQTNYVSGRAMIDSGCEIALATDYNPGTCTLNSLPQIIFLATMFCNITFEEAFKGITFNAAKSLGCDDKIGMIKSGYNADILFWDIDNIYEIPYWFNSNRLIKVLKSGKLIIF